MNSELLEFALSLARAAEAEIMPRFRACAVDWKPDGSEVTDADRRAEEVMRELLAKHFPGAAVLGEEFGGSQAATTNPLWLLDPIDGTSSFVLGLPIFGTLIGYVDNGEPQMGVIHLPAMGETIYAVRGSGCWTKVAGSDPKRAHVSRVKNLREAYVSTTSPSSLRGDAGGGPAINLNQVIQQVRKFRFISDCVQHALVAQGRIDAAVEPLMHPWDIAALVPCVEEAGGTVSDLEGSRDGVVWKPNLLSSSSAELHKEILSILQNQACDS